MLQALADFDTTGARAAAEAVDESELELDDDETRDAVARTTHQLKRRLDEPLYKDATITLRQVCAHAQ